MIYFYIKKCLYSTAFESVASGRPIHIPKIVTGEYIRHAEEIVSISYTQSEKFSSVNIALIISIYKSILDKYTRTFCIYVKIMLYL